MTAPFHIELPPRPEFASAARLFVAGVARSFGCAPDDTEDLKLAISEAVAIAAIAAGGPDAEPLEVALHTADGVLVVDVAHPSAFRAVGGGDADAAVALSVAVLEGLFPDMEASASGLRFRLPLG